MEAKGSSKQRQQALPHYLEQGQVEEAWDKKNPSTTSNNSQSSHFGA